MHAALAVRGEDDRPVRGGFAEEFLISGEHVAIGEIERASRIVVIGQKGAERRLPVFRRPDLADAVERARLAADEQGARDPAIRGRSTGAFQAPRSVKLVGWTKKTETRGGALLRCTPGGSQSDGLLAMSGRAIQSAAWP